MKTRKVLFYLLAGLLGGCVPVLSLHPLYDNRHIVFDEKLLGTFTEPNGVTWQFTHTDEPNAYQLIYSAVSKEEKMTLKGLFLVHLVKLNDLLFMDVYPKEAPWGGDEKVNQTKWPYNTFFMLPFHTFVKVETVEPQLKLCLTDNDELKKLLDKNPKAVRHELVEDKPVLTASTEQLQKFVLKYANDKRVFSDEHILSRTSTEPNAPDANSVPKKDVELPT
jgi:hypothetical protein